ncbi:MULTISPECIES: DEAD/DEAH box helicase [unclassified Arthrobacter]|uniref:DEAD/DEAH box helicase n=1 Tax=unclassified Arthrobacter TaxID=235627 RepID=UPI001E4CFA7F|nr:MULTISPECIES: DEAD/DEAH box helicase [unclassified Arthrobacter]MCC9144681.1 DEAD/DEAH box helicase [Arthrobacter sp. zg-Y919]MDK1275907.1 DEAD/DEAH box helicase [Arthrobacter sp. zg.Y919]MDM7990234.1 DEAD/DEAH box helicase [Arthrobacter sp. zg-Y877]WIB02737.1 DEAD/DEAH box helicase [Arthrobacter sp. zg-Y919]
MTTFAALGVPKALVSSLAAAGIDEAFPIQVETLPDTLKGRDVLGRGRTGSGKTLAFSLPLVARLAENEAAYRRRPNRPLGLVLAPTRELATQINNVIEPLAKELGLNTTVIYGGVSQQRQEKALKAGVDIVIACPGRLEDLMKQKVISLESVEITVLDEADHMADLGFLPVVQRLLDRTPEKGQRMLFSATLDNGVDKLVRRYLSNPLTHSVDEPQAAVSTMEHHVLLVQDQTAKKLLVKELAGGQGRRIMFMRTKHHARKMAQFLTDNGIPTVDLHGNLSQNARDRNLAEFASGDVRVLVATDVAARGVHVDDVELVVHIDPPTEHKAYLHRSGRTARAGSSGTVVTLTLPEQKSEVSKLMKAAGVDVSIEKVSHNSPSIAKLVGERAAVVEPHVRAAQLAAKSPQQGGGRSTGANAQRKRAARSTGAPRAGGRGGTGGRGRVSAERPDRSERNDRAAAGDVTQRPARSGDGRRNSASAATASGRNRRPATGQRAEGAGTGQRAGGAARGAAGAASGRPARAAGPRRATAPASNERRSR